MKVWFLHNQSLLALHCSVLHGPGLGPRVGPARSPWAGPGQVSIIVSGPGRARAGPGAGLKLAGRAGPGLVGNNFAGCGPGLGLTFPGLGRAWAGPGPGLGRAWAGPGPIVKVTIILT